jgi:hypothetical protein
MALISEAESIVFNAIYASDIQIHYVYLINLEALSMFISNSIIKLMV